mmetsp:Transcript_7563/g.15019  ORF Transcript_7563/g.15019 Transcript_7563/m.15019 type:complete len:120 (+) Transcript_7563:12-371(+)
MTHDLTHDMSLSLRCLGTCSDLVRPESQLMRPRCRRVQCTQTQPSARPSMRKQLAIAQDSVAQHRAKFWRRHFVLSFFRLSFFRSFFREEERTNEKSDERSTLFFRLEPEERRRAFLRV